MEGGIFVAKVKRFDARMTINIPQATKNAVEKIADEERVSCSYFVFRAVQDYLDNYSAKGGHASNEA